MRQSIGQSWLIGLMILFIFIFAGYIILTMDYNKSVRVKNEALAIVEKYEGLNENSITLLNNYLKHSGYRTMGACGSADAGGLYGALSLDENKIEPVVQGQKYYYCVKKFKGVNTLYYYQVSMFYQFNLPVLGDFTKFTIRGTTTNIIPKDNDTYCTTIGGGEGGCESNSGNSNLPSTPNTPSTPSSSYTVTFYVDGTLYDTKTVTSGGKVSLPLNPTKSGYTFNGWKSNGSNFDFNSSIYKNMRLDATWSTASGGSSTPHKYSVWINMSGGEYKGQNRFEDHTDENGMYNLNDLINYSHKAGYELQFFMHNTTGKMYRKEDCLANPSSCNVKITKDMEVFVARWNSN